MGNMPKSKRDKKISLTRTKKKGLETKQKLVENVRSYVDNYARIFVFSVHNMRNDKLKDIRQEWKHSRFMFGKNKVMAVALGRNAEEEYQDNLHNIAIALRGEKGLLLTNKTKDEVKDYFDNLYMQDFARSGTTATQDIVIEEGPLKQFPHNMEPQLRQLGLPTALKKGVVTLTKEHTVCKQGDTLTPEQARILKLFKYEMANFHITIECMWNKEGKFEKFDDRPEQYVVPKILFKPNKDATDSDDEPMTFEPCDLTTEPDGDDQLVSDSEEEEDEG